MTTPSTIPTAAATDSVEMTKTSELFRVLLNLQMLKQHTNWKDQRPISSSMSISSSQQKKTFSDRLCDDLYAVEMVESVINESDETNEFSEILKRFRYNFLDGQTKLGTIELVARLIEPPYGTNDILHEFGKVNEGVSRNLSDRREEKFQHR